MIKEYPIAGEAVHRDGVWTQNAENPRTINLCYVTSVRQFYPNSLLVSLVGESQAFAVIAEYDAFVRDWRTARS